MALLYPVVVPCSVILSLTLDEENSERLMLKYYVFLLKTGISDPVAAVRQYRGFVDSHLQTVEGIKKNEWRFKSKTVDAGTVNSPLLVDGLYDEFLREFIENTDSIQEIKTSYVINMIRIVFIDIL